MTAVEGDTLCNLACDEDWLEWFAAADGDLNRRRASLARHWPLLLKAIRSKKRAPEFAAFVFVTALKRVRKWSKEYRDRRSRTSFHDWLVGLIYEAHDDATRADFREKDRAARTAYLDDDLPFRDSVVATPVDELLAENDCCLKCRSRLSDYEKLFFDHARGVLEKEEIAEHVGRPLPAATFSRHKRKAFAKYMLCWKLCMKGHEVKK